jgi:hypothetical protein
LSPNLHRKGLKQQFSRKEVQSPIVIRINRCCNAQKPQDSAPSGSFMLLLTNLCLSGY